MEEPQMREQKGKPGRPWKWTSDAERMRVTRAAKRAEREAAALRAENGSRSADRRRGEASAPVESSVASASQAPASAVAPDPVADHTNCEAAIRALRSALVNLEERYDDLVLRRWIISHPTAWSLRAKPRSGCKS